MKSDEVRRKSLKEKRKFCFFIEERLKFQFCSILQWSTWRWNYELDIYTLVLRYHFHYASFIAQRTKMRRRRKMKEEKRSQITSKGNINLEIEKTPWCALSRPTVSLWCERIMFRKTFSLRFFSLVEVFHIRLELNARPRTTSRREKYENT